MARLYRGNKLITNLNIYKGGEPSEGGASLNLAYGDTPPTDTSKIWLQCAEPQAVEVQNYLGEASVGEVVNYGGISNPVDGHSDFRSSYYRTCYIGNNQIAIVGQNHIRIYNLTSKNYIADYTISAGLTGYTNILFKDNVLYFGYGGNLYSFDLTTQTLTKLYSYTYTFKYIAFYTDTEIDIYEYSNGYNYIYRYNMTTNTATQLFSISGSNFSNYLEYRAIKTNDTLYYFYYFNSSKAWKYVDNDNKFTPLTSLGDFITSIGGTSFDFSSFIYDGEQFIYLIGGAIGGMTYDNIIRYDTINDTFELLDQKLLKGKELCFSLLVDNRVYIFGGLNDSSTPSKYGRANYLDYFDLSYPLPQNNCIITTNTINTDNALPLINTDKLKLNSNIASAYLGNADNLAEKVNAYYHNGYGWVGINCEDYDTYFVWQTITNETINSALVIDLSTYYTTNSKDVVLSVSSTNATAFEVTLSGTELTITPLEVSQTTTITVTATVNAVSYETTFSVTSADIIASA